MGQFFVSYSVVCISTCRCVRVCMRVCVCVHVHAQGCCSEVEAQQAGRMQTTSQPIQCELPTIPVQIGSHFLKGVSFNESAAENLKLKTVRPLTPPASIIVLIPYLFSRKVQVAQLATTTSVSSLSFQLSLGQ